MNKKFTINLILSLSTGFITATHPFKFHFEDASYKLYINHKQKKIALRKKHHKRDKESVMMCATSCFIRTNPNCKIWQNRLPDRSIITIDREQETISITRHGKTQSESTFLQNLHKYFPKHEPYKS